MSDDPKGHDSKPGDKLSGVRVAAATCVRCKEPVQPRYRPFCSQRCADIDLGSWFRGSYRVETNEGPDRNGGDEDENR